MLPIMAEKIRLTHATLKVLCSIMASRNGEMSGSQVAVETGLASGSLYPILLRLEHAGLLKSRREAIDPRKEGRPRRRLYKMTAAGAAQTRAAMAELMPGGQVSWAS
jgi:PadR family transcriptional regulator, regulatory protein PadR